MDWKIEILGRYVPIDHISNTAACILRLHNEISAKIKGPPIGRITLLHGDTVIAEIHQDDPCWTLEYLGKHFDYCPSLSKAANSLQALITGKTVKLVEKITDVFRFVADLDRDIVRLTYINGNMAWIQQDMTILANIHRDGDRWMFYALHTEEEEFDTRGEAVHALHEWITDYVDGGLNAEVV